MSLLAAAGGAVSLTISSGLALFKALTALAAVHPSITEAEADDDDDDGQMSPETTTDDDDDAPWPPLPMYEATPTVSTALDQLDLHTFTRRRYVVAAASSAATDCAICLSPFEDGDPYTIMPARCCHEFHKDCIAKWLMTGNNTCPLCRAQLRWLNQAWCTHFRYICSALLQSSQMTTASCSGF